MPDPARRAKRRSPRGGGTASRRAKGEALRGAKGRPSRARTRPAPRASRSADAAVRQQIVVSGVGGQGVLFIGRLLAEAAIARGLSVLSSETHGMAQRGGTVIAHLKVGPFSSPLVRPGQADVLILLKEENAASHGRYLRPGGWAAVNARSAPAALEGAACRTVDADTLARESGLGKAVNLIVLGRALAAPAGGGKGGAGLFCAPDEIRGILRSRLAGEAGLLEASLAALGLGAADGHAPGNRR